MTPEIETASPDSGRNGGDGSDATITHVSDNTSESSASNRGQGRGRGGCTGRGGRQGCGRLGGRFNRPA